MGRGDLVIRIIHRFKNTTVINGFLAIFKTFKFRFFFSRGSLP